MNKYKGSDMFRVILIVITSIMLASPLTQAEQGQAERQTVRLMANAAPPYIDANLPEQGLVAELLQHVFQRTDYHAELEIVSWSRAIEGVRIGLYDALAAAWYTEERGKEFIFSEPYLSSKLILVKLRRDTADYYQLGDLKGKRLGVQVDFAYGVDLDSVAGLRQVPQNYVIQNLLDLLNGKVDFVIGDQRTIALQLRDYLASRLHEFEVVDIGLQGRDRHLAATRAAAGGEKLIGAFNRALADAKADGSLAAIIAKWDARYELTE